jgi:ArsR family transcriptional regulator
MSDMQARRPKPPAGSADLDPALLSGNVAEAAALLKALAHEGRLMTLCHLATGEKSVSELEELLGLRQAAVSQQLARLRLEGLVDARRDGKTIHYSVRDPRAARLMRVIHELFCGPA